MLHLDHKTTRGFVVSKPPREKIGVQKTRRFEAVYLKGENLFQASGMHAAPISLPGETFVVQHHFV